MLPVPKYADRAGELLRGESFTFANGNTTRAAVLHRLRLNWPDWIWGVRQRGTRFTIINRGIKL